MSNIRNSRTTHPLKDERRQRAAERFSISKARCERGDATYQATKLQEAAALGIANPLYV